MAGAAGTGALLVAGRVPSAAALLNEDRDVVIVGSGAAGLSAALGVKREDPAASVLIVEAKRSHGGTSARSGGRLWIPNNSDMRAAGLADPRDAALRYMARLSHPSAYDPEAPGLGLDPRHLAQLQAFYDAGAEILDHYRRQGILPWEVEQGRAFPWQTSDPLRLQGKFAPDYHPELEENVPKRGRTITPHRFDLTGLTTEVSGAPNYGASLAGSDLVEWLRHACAGRGVRFRFDTRVTDLVWDATRVAGVRTAQTIDDTTLPLHALIRARRGVIFATGGFSKSAPKLARQFTGDRAFSGGGCSVTSARGDLVDIARRYGLALEHMDAAWLIQNVYEQFKLDPDSRLSPNYLAFQAYWLNGDSMIVVNRRGVRVVNEKINYDDRTRAHFEPDNRFLFSVFDQHTLERFAAFGGHVTPMVQTLIGPAASVAELERRLAARLEGDPATAAFGLAPGFAAGLATTLERFNGFARTGVDDDFHRGETDIEIWWHAFCLNFQGISAGPVKDCISANVDDDGNPYPNPTMRPLRPPYHAVVLSSGLQDTKGGPAVDHWGRILDARGRPVPGLYGAGNCIASPAGQGYWGAGGTLGPAVVFGHLAGRHAGRRRA